MVTLYFVNKWHFVIWLICVITILSLMIWLTFDMLAGQNVFG